MMKLKDILGRSAIFLAVALPVCGSADEKIVFSESFDSPGALKKWHVVKYPGGGTFHVENGALSVNHTHNPGKGSYIEIPLPAVGRGQVDFDVLIDPDRKNPAARIGLTFEIFNIATFWHDSCRDWRMYFPEPNSMRLPYFNIEPVGHRRIAPVPKHKYVHYRILFDEERDLAEFYAVDMKDPKAARYDISVFGHGFYRGGWLRIGSFGYASDSYRTLVDNVVVRELPSGERIPDRKHVLIFDGMGSDHFKAYQFLRESPLWKNENVHRYAWNSSGANVLPEKNNFQYFGMPGFQTVEGAELIIFNDAPNVPPPLQKQILKSVQEGADLLILSGLFSLGKGGFRNSVLEKALPVILTDDIWTVSGGGKTAYTLRTENGFQWNAEGKTVSCFWDLKPAGGSEILMTASEPGWFGRKNIPVLLRKPFGRGSVYVLSATACGPCLESSFWKGDFLEALLKTIRSARGK